MTTLSASIRSAALIGAVAHALSCPAQGQQAAKPGFVIKKGKDTVAVEVYSRDASMLTSEIYQSNGVRTQYTATLGADASVTYIEMTRQGRQGQGTGLTIAFGDTLVSASMTGPGGENEKMSIASRGRNTPFLAVSFALCEQILRSSRLDVGKSQKWTAFRLAAGDTTTLTVTRFHADSALFSMPDVQLKVAVSATGDVTGGRHLGQDWLIERRK
jgi:hypothetical protein